MGIASFPAHRTETGQYGEQESASQRLFCKLLQAGAEKILKLF